jgi:hypothetical protein
MVQLNVSNIRLSAESADSGRSGSPRSEISEHLEVVLINLPKFIPGSEFAESAWAGHDNRLAVDVASHSLRGGMNVYDVTEPTLHAIAVLIEAHRVYVDSAQRRAELNSHGRPVFGQDVTACSQPAHEGRHLLLVDENVDVGMGTGLSAGQRVDCPATIDLVNGVGRLEPGDHGEYLSPRRVTHRVDHGSSLHHAAPREHPTFGN